MFIWVLTIECTIECGAAGKAVFCDKANMLTNQSLDGNGKSNPRVFDLGMSCADLDFKGKTQPLLVDTTTKNSNCELNPSGNL